MTRQNIYDITLLQLGMDTQDRRSDPRIVFMTLDTVRSGLIPDYITTYGESALELFCVPVVLPVQFDKVRNKPFVELTFQLLGMRDRTGLVQVALTQDEDVVFVPMQLGMNAVYANLEAGGAAGNLLYQLEGTKIYFPLLPAGVTEILIKAIPTIYDLVDDRQQLPMPAEFIDMMIQGCRERLAPQGQVPRQDYINDTRAGA